MEESRRPKGEYYIGSEVELPFFKRESEGNDYTVWKVVWRWPWGNVPQKYKINLSSKEIKNTIKKLPTLWDVVKFITDEKHSTTIKENNNLGFRSWLEARDISSNIRDLIRAHFSEEDLNQKLDLSKIHSFLALPGLRDLVSPQQIKALETTLDSMSKQKKSQLSLNWLAVSLGG